jgi:hypothetical protein
MWSSNHGTWSYQAELPKNHDGTRRTRRRHGFTSQTDALGELDKPEVPMTIDLDRIPDEITAEPTPQAPP